MNWRKFTVAMAFLVAAIGALVWLLPGIYAASATGNATAMLSELVFALIVVGLLLFIAFRVVVSDRAVTEDNEENP